MANVRIKDMTTASSVDSSMYMVVDSSSATKKVSMTTLLNYFNKLPAPPSSNGTYTLKCTVSGSSVTYFWQ